MSVKARIWWDSSIQAYKLQTTFKPELVEFLKKQIPVSDRSWDNNTKIWTFTEGYLDGVRKLCILLYGNNDVAVLDRKTVEGQSTRTVSVSNLNTLDTLCVQFVKLLPFDAAQSAYRKASLVLHPDRPGGNMEKMSQLNTIWTRLEKELWPNG
jgi:hypothetical protein